MHIHWFRKRFGPVLRVCRCGMAKRRMMGGYGYAYMGGLWMTTSKAIDHEQIPVDEAHIAKEED